MVDSQDILALLREGDVFKPWESRRVLGPVQQILTSCEAQLWRVEVITRVRQVEGTIHANDPGILCAPASFPGLRGIENGIIEAREVIAVA